MVSQPTKMMMLFFWLLALTKIVAAAPSIGFPINSQVPPVARVSKEFQFVFAESTFISSAKSIGYTLSGSPAWLNLDPGSRTLSGIPPAEAAGPVSLRLVASDETGSTAMDVTLIVSAEPGPGLGTPVPDQLVAQGAFSAPDSFMIARSGPLSLSFSKSTFTNTNEKTVYYAICANNTPLPSWITFDPIALSLTGTAPQSTSPSELPQSYGIQLIASDVVGFSGAVAKFQIMVGGHVFAFGKSLEVIKAPQGVPFKFSGLGAALVLDGRPVNPTEIGQVVADIPEWMSLDKNTLMISGIPPISETSTRNFTVTVADVHGDTASTILMMQMLNNSSTLFRGSIGILNATSGSDFDYTIDRFMLASPDVEVAVDLGENTTWLKFDASALRLYGRVPKDIETQKLLLNVTAHLGSQTESQVITIDVERRTERSGGESNKSSKSTSAGASPSSIQSSETSSATSIATAKSRRKWLPAVILLPTAMALAALILVCVCKRKRRRRSSDDSEKLEKEEISRPMEQDSSWLTIREEETVGQPRPTQKRGSSKPPKLEIKDLWSSSPIRRGSRSRWSKMAEEEDNLSQAANMFREYVGRNFNAVRPEPAAVQAFSRQAEEYALSCPTTRRRSARSRRSAASTYSSLSEAILPSCRYPRPGKTNPRMSLLSSKLLSGQRISGLGRANISMGHGVEIPERVYVHRRAESEMALSTRLSQAGFGGIGGPHDFGVVRNTWRNARARSNDTSEYATTESSSRHHDGKQSEVSWMMQAFPPTPTCNTLQICSPVPVKGSHDLGKNHQRTTVRMVAPSPSSSVLRQPTLQNFHKQRISSRQRLNPFLSAGPASRASSLSLLKLSRKSARLSRNQSINSLISESQGLGSPNQRHRQSRLDKSGDSPTRASFLSSSQSPHRRHRPPHRRHRLSAFGQFLHQRHRSSISMTSSKRYMTPDQSDHGEEAEQDDVHSESFYDAGHDDIEEDIDEDGQRLWRPVESYSPTGATQYGTGHSYLGSDIFMPRWSSSARDGRGDNEVGGMLEHEKQKRHIDSNKHNDDVNDHNAEEDGKTTTNPISKHQRPESRKRLLVVGGARGKRPISMDVQSGLGKGWSMRGDMRGDMRGNSGRDMRRDSKEASAFL